MKITFEITPQEAIEMASGLTKESQTALFKFFMDAGMASAVQAKQMHEQTGKETPVNPVTDYYEALFAQFKRGMDVFSPSKTGTNDPDSHSN